MSKKLKFKHTTKKGIPKRLDITFSSKYLTKPQLTKSGAIACMYGKSKGQGFYFKGLGVTVKKWKGLK